MDDQDLINLQKLVGRGPQPTPFTKDPPYNVQLAQAVAAMGGTPSSTPTAHQLMLADAVRNYGESSPLNPDTDAYRQALANAVRTYGDLQTGPAQDAAPDLAPPSAPPSKGSSAFSAIAGVGSQDATADPKILYAMSSPANLDLPWQTMADGYQRMAAKATPPPAQTTPSAVQTLIDPIPGYDETGDNAWRAANDKIFLDAVNRYNAANGYRPGDPGYWTADMLKAQAMVETGGNKTAFLTDPLQVNTRSNWDPVNKPKVTGLTSPNQAMTPEVSANAALKWLQFKAHTRDKSGRPTGYIGDEGALWRYSGDVTPRSRYTGNPDDDGLTQQDWYASTIPRLAQEAAETRASTRGKR